MAGNRRGPSPKPTALKLLEGNPGKQKLNKREPVGAGRARDLRCPTHIKGVARKEWKRLVDTCGWLTATDMPAIESASVQYKIYRGALANVEDLGPVQTTESGYQAVTGWYSVMSKSLDSYIRACQELGATPASRSRVELPETGGKDELEEWQSSN